MLVVGAGALGSPVAAYLAGAGRRPARASSTPTTSRSRTSTASRCTSRPTSACAKAESAAAKLRFLNPEVVVEPYQARFAPPMLEGADLVVDCSDSFATRYEVNAACCAARIPLVEGGVVGLSGLVMAIRPGESACYRCAFPGAAAAGAAPSCAEAGVLGPAAGVIGSLQALEALKLLAGLDGALLDAFLQVDLHDHTFLRVTTSRRDGLPGLCHAVAHDRHPHRDPRARGAAPRHRRRPRARPRRPRRLGARDPRHLAGRARAARPPRRPRAERGGRPGRAARDRRRPRARSPGSRSTRAPTSATGCSSTTGWAS